MRLLDRYLLRELLIPFGYCLTGFFIFWLTFNLFDDLSDFQKLKLTGLDIAEYYLVKAPEWLTFPIVQITLLLALLYALTNHARHHEITAMRAAGLSLPRLTLPYLVVGFVLSSALLVLNELWVPQSFEMAERILAKHSPDSAQSTTRVWEKALTFENTRDRRRWLVEAYHLETHEMIRPHLEWLLADGTLRSISAEAAHFVDGAWVLTNVTELVHPPAVGALPLQFETNSLVLGGFAETPEQIQSEIKIGRIHSLREARKVQLSVREILEYLRTHPDSGRTALLETKMHRRLAAPWTCLVVVLIAIPFGAASGRRNVYVGVASSLLICFAYFVALQLSLALGSSGRWPPWLAAWMPNALFALGGLVLMTRLR